MLELKPLSKEGIPGALARVERYRLLNEPEQAEVFGVLKAWMAERRFSARP